MVLSCIGLLSILNIFLINNSTQSAWLRKYYIIQHLFFLHERKRCPDQKSNPGNLIYKVNNLPIMFSRSTIRPALFHSDNFNNLLYRVHSSTEKATENWNTNNNWRINIKKRKSRKSRKPKLKIPIELKRCQDQEAIPGTLAYKVNISFFCGLFCWASYMTDQMFLA